MTLLCDVVFKVVYYLRLDSEKHIFLKLCLEVSKHRQSLSGMFRLK